MPTVWRLSGRRHAATAFSGEGSRIEGGRYTSEGIAAVYCSEHRSLALLEVAVHLDETMRAKKWVLVSAEIPRTVKVTTVEAPALPANWRHTPADPALQSIGDDWVQEGTTAVLRVPSAVVPEEWNYILNPAHAAFAKIRRGTPVDYAVDERLAPAAPG